MGVGLSFYLYDSYAAHAFPFYVFAMFIGIAMSITAFPVLAHILRSRGMSNTWLGQMAIACAATDDITAWCLLAVLLSIMQGGTALSAFGVLLTTAAFVAVMLLMRPLLRRWLDKAAPRGKLTTPAVAGIFLLLLISALCSDLIGIHVLFGAFLAGLILPAGKNLRLEITGRLDDVCLVLLLPVFFMYTGLRTRIDLLNDVSSLLVCLLIIVTAVAGKFGGSSLAARYTGLSWRESLSLGALMNTRGLVELVVLNIGLDKGIITPALFTMLVLMAVITTAMAGPLLNYFYKARMPRPVIDGLSLDTH
jgi:Kef-type K+ transport system membrane component KefB